MPRTSRSEVRPTDPNRTGYTCSELNADAETAAVDADDAVVYPDETFYAEDF